MRDYFFYFPLFIPVIATIIIFVLPHFGWNKIADKSVDLGVKEFKSLGTVSGKIGFASFKNMIHFSYNESGVRLSCLFFKKKIEIPWSQLKRGSTRDFSFKYFSYYYIINEKYGWISISKKKFKEIEGYLLS